MIRNYNSTGGGSRDPIWTQVTGDPAENLQRSRSSDRERAVSPGLDITNTRSAAESIAFRLEDKKGLNVFSTAVFVAGEMAGSGVLALPKAIVDSGWIGLVLLVVFCFNACYGGTRLGACWSILEERYPEHRSRTRNPYSVIAHRAVGPHGRKIVSICIQITLFGAGTVYLLLASQILHELLLDYLPHISYCLWFVIISIAIAPATWLKSPKEFSLVGVGALLTTAIACVLFFTQIVMDGMNNSSTPVRHDIHGFQDFFLSFGTLLFAFGGASTFPTIQNDMEDKKKFSKSAVIAFIVILVLYFPVSAGGYLVYGEDVTPNIAMVLTRTSLVSVANILMAIHLILAFLIVINPVCQEMEENLQIPHYHKWRRYFLRSFIVFCMLLIGITIPQFGKILSLIGGSTITLLTFVFPSYFYMKLCDQTNPLWPEHEIPLHIRIYLWELIFIGLIGGVCSTYSAFKAIFISGVTKPCYWP